MPRGKRVRLRFMLDDDLDELPTLGDLEKNGMPPPFR